MSKKIAQIYLIKRIPRRIGVFDYAIPDSIKVSRGSLVNVPFRDGQALGIVANLLETSTVKGRIKPIKNLVNEVVFSDKELKLIENIAKDLIQSVPSLLYAAIPSPPKRKSTPLPILNPLPLTIPKNEILAITKISQTIAKHKRIFVTTPDLKRMAAIIATASRNCQGAISIVTPNVRDAKILFQRLSHLRPNLISGEDSNNSRWLTWTKWRKQKNGILIGSRLTSLLPHPNLTTIFIVRSSNKNHYQSGQNPRYDTRRIAELANVRTIHLDVTPRLEDINFPIVNLFSEPEKKIVEINREKRTAPHFAIGSTTLHTIEKTIANKKRVILVFNKKHTSEGSKFSNINLATALKKLLPQIGISVVEKGSLAPAFGQTDILIVTNYYLENIFQSFNPPNIGLVALLDADTPLFHSDTQARELALHNAYEWQGLARACKADFLIQTQNGDLFKTKLQTILNQELKNRIAYNQAPARRWMRISFKNSNYEKDIVEINDLVKSTAPESILEKVNNSLEIGIKHNDVQNILKAFSSLPDRIIIDSNVI